MLDLLPARILTAAWGMHCGGTRVQGGPLVIPASGGVAWAETRVGGNGWIEHCVEVEPADLLLEVRRETEARAEPSALSRSEDGGAVGGWEAGKRR